MSKKDDIIEHDDTPPSGPIMINEDENSRPGGPITRTGGLRYCNKAVAAQGSQVLSKRVTILQEEWQDMKTGECQWIDVPTVTE